MMNHFILKSFDGSINWGEIGRKSAKIITASLLLTIDNIFCASLVKSSSHALIFPILIIKFGMYFTEFWKFVYHVQKDRRDIIGDFSSVQRDFLSEKLPHGNDPYEYRWNNEQKTADKAKNDMASEELNSVKLDMI